MTPSTIPRLLATAVANFGEREALVDGDVRLTFQELAERVERAARALLASGVAPGERVALWAPNAWEWAVVALAVHSVGAILVPVNTRFKAREAAFVLKRARARLLLTVTDFLDTDYLALLRGSFPDLQQELPELVECVVLRGTTPKDAVAYETFLERDLERCRLDLGHVGVVGDHRSGAPRVRAAGTY